MAKKPEGPKKTTATPAKKTSKTPEKKVVKKSQSAPVKKTAGSTNQKPASQPPKKVAPRPVNEEPPKIEAVDYNEEYPFTKEGVVQWYKNLEDGVKSAIGEETDCKMPKESVIKTIENPNISMRIAGLFVPSVPEIIQFGRIIRLRMLGVVMDTSQGRKTFMDIVRSIPDKREDFNDSHLKTEIYLNDLNSVSASLLGVYVGRSMFRQRSAALVIEALEKMAPVHPTISVSSNEAEVSRVETNAPASPAQPSHPASDME